MKNASQQRIKEKDKDILQQAAEFIQLMHTELEKSVAETKQRLDEIESEIESTGTYQHTEEELVFGARAAWRNSNRCIGRLFWQKLNVIDKRHLTEEADMLKAVETHIEYATNHGKIRPTITIFPQGDAHTVPFFIENDQLIRYADDPIVAELKDKIESIEPIRSRFLPLLYRFNGQTKIHHIDESLIMEVPLTHPKYKAFDALGLKWYAVPMISGMVLKIGGIKYSTVPFNGWYMESEIASRNLLDCYRYNLIETIAESFDLDTTSTQTYWRDKALVELNYAVYHSYKRNGVAIVDHYTASKQFEKFEENETHAGREVTGDWTWLIPPISPSLVHNFHKGYNNEYKDPNFYYRKKGCPFSN